MDIISIIVPLALLITAIICLAYLSIILFLPMIRMFKEKSESNKINTLVTKINIVDELLAQKKPLLALKILKNTAYLETIYKAELLDLVREHHQNILSRSLIIAEELNTRADNLATVEYLFQEQVELQKLFLKAYESYNSLNNRRGSSGKAIPQWTKDDFEKRLLEIQEELNKCKSSLRKNLEELFKSLELNPSDNNITYH